MRAITGWRFFFVIVLPLFLALVSSVALFYDLLSNVESSGNWAENSRNRAALHEALVADARDLGRLALQNSRWEEAWSKTKGPIDEAWFQRTWGSTISVGSSYDIVAVVDRNTGQILAHNDRTSSGALTVASLTGVDAGSLRNVATQAESGVGVATGHMVFNAVPAAVAISPIVNPNQAKESNNRLLVLVRLVSPEYVAALEKRLLISELAIETSSGAMNSSLSLKDLNGSRVLAVSWSDKSIGALVANFVWKKASPVMAFLAVVMCSVVYVCWQLLQQLSQREEQATHDSTHDHLTGLSNRHALVQALKDTPPNENVTSCIAFADLDGFKDINDSYGHEFGDRLICMVAAGIKQLAHGSRLVARMGGDEFVILYQGEEAVQRARQFSERLIKMLSQPFDMEGRLALVGASIGIAVGQNDSDETELLRRADVAMYRAKTNGKNRFCVFEESFDNERRETLEIAAELKQIIQDGRLEIAFQPIVSAKTGEITGVEALARWPSTSQRQVNADRFITVAESAGLIDELGDCILAKACGAARAWPTLRIAVNISAVQLNNPRFVERALSTLANYNIAPNRMEFEITETSVIHDSERARQVFKALQSVGIKVALDDFGTGFSSIGYLRRFNFDRIKIDKSIVNKVLTSPSELAVVQGVLLVARGLSAEVTAEGVEREDEVRVLHLAGCTELQGYHFHKPLEASEISALVAQGKAAAAPLRTRIVA